MEHNTFTWKVLVLIFKYFIGRWAADDSTAAVQSHITNPFFQSVAAPKGLDLKLLQAYQEVLSLI